MEVGACSTFTWFSTPRDPICLIVVIPWLRKAIGWIQRKIQGLWSSDRFIHCTMTWGFWVQNVCNHTSLQSMETGPVFDPHFGTCSNHTFFSSCGMLQLGQFYAFFYISLYRKQPSQQQHWGRLQRQILMSNIVLMASIGLPEK